MRDDMKMFKYTLLFSDIYKDYVIAQIYTIEYLVIALYSLCGELLHIPINRIRLEPDISMYLFSTLEDTVNFASKKIDLCPAEGEFYGYKKALLIKDMKQTIVLEFEYALEPSSYGINYDVVGRCIVTLLISAKTARTGCYYEKKCRAESAKVVRIEKICADGSLGEVGNEYFAMSMYYENHKDYVLGKTTYADSFDDSKEIACSNGIHFFLKKEEALAYMGG